MPGGRLEADESPQERVAREILDELGPRVEVEPLLDVRVHEPFPDVGELVLDCGFSAGKVGRVAYGPEHTALGSFGVDALGESGLPTGYARVAWARSRMDRTDRP